MTKRLIIASLLCVSLLSGASKREADLTLENQKLAFKIGQLEAKLDAANAKLLAGSDAAGKSSVTVAAGKAAALTSAQEVKRLTADNVSLRTVNARLVQEAKNVLINTNAEVAAGTKVSTDNNVLIGEVKKLLAKQFYIDVALNSGIFVLLTAGLIVIVLWQKRKSAQDAEARLEYWATTRAIKSHLTETLDAANHTAEKFDKVQAVQERTLDLLQQQQAPKDSKRAK